MQLITFNLSQLHKHGTAFYEFLELRKRFLVDDLSWDVPHDDDVEMDQYDNPNAYYALVTNNDRVVGGVRAHVSYGLGVQRPTKLPDTTPEIVSKQSLRLECLDCTRLVVSNHLTCEADRLLCLKMLIDGLEMIAGKTQVSNFGAASSEVAIQLANHLKLPTGALANTLGYGANTGVLPLNTLAKARTQIDVGKGQNTIVAAKANWIILRFFFSPEDLEDRIEALDAKAQYDQKKVGRGWAIVFRWWATIGLCIGQIWRINPLARAISYFVYRQEGDR